MRAGRALLYADLVIALLLSLFFAWVVFQLPGEVFKPPMSELYMKLAASVLLGFSLGLSVYIIVDLLVFPVAPKPRRAARPPRPPAPRPAKPAIRPLTEQAPLRFISKHKLLRGLAERIGLSIANDVLKAGETLSPYRFAAKTLFSFLVSLMILTPVAIALAVLVHPSLLLLAVAPLALLYYPKLKLKNTIGDRRRGLEDEIPFFTVFASILQSVGISLYNSFLAIIGRGIFKQIEKDALLIKRDVEFFFKSPIEALEDAGRRHPHEKMRTLLLGYTSEWRSGGDVSAYMDAKADDYLREMEFRWRQYAERVTDIGETVISLLFVLPMMILMAAFIFPGQAMTMTSLTLALVIPMLTAVVFGVVHNTQPKTYNVVGGDWKLAAAAGVATGVVVALLQVPAWLCLAASLAAASAVYGASVVVQMREIEMMERALPQFLRDVTEYRKMGYDITKGITKIAEENTYNPVFDSLLDSVAKQLNLGLRLAEVEVPTRSWLTKMCFFLLAQVVESGGGTAKCLETLTNFMNHVVRVKREAKASMRLYQILSMFTPIALSIVVAMMFTLVTSFSTFMAPGLSDVLSGEAIAEMIQIPQALVEQCYLLVVVSSICVALLSTKAVNLTAKNTIWITVNLALAAAGISLSMQLADIIMRALLGAGAHL